jgi:hypothetical protein
MSKVIEWPPVDSTSVVSNHRFCRADARLGCFVIRQGTIASRISSSLRSFRPPAGQQFTAENIQTH